MYCCITARYLLLIFEKNVKNDAVAFHLDHPLPQVPNSLYLYMVQSLKLYSEIFWGFAATKQFVSKNVPQISAFGLSQFC